MSDYFIEVYKSSLTGNTLFSKPTKINMLEKTLSETKECFHLTTIDVIKFKWMMTKNGIYWYNGLRRLQQTPWVYTIPPLHFLNGTKAPTSKIMDYTIKRKETEPVKAGELF